MEFELPPPPAPPRGAIAIELASRRVDFQTKSKDIGLKD
jgi:hypothetical protein